MVTFFKVLQIVVSVLFILTVLIQQRSSGLSSAFGGQAGAIQTTKRGAEKVVFNASVILAILFVVLSLAFIFIE
jgi:preprotein translocase subunit SecG